MTAAIFMQSASTKLDIYHLPPLLFRPTATAIFTGREGMCWYVWASHFTDMSFSEDRNGSIQGWYGAGKIRHRSFSTVEATNLDEFLEGPNTTAPHGPATFRVLFIACMHQLLCLQWRGKFVPGKGEMKKAIGVSILIKDADGYHFLHSIHRSEEGGLFNNGGAFSSKLSVQNQ